MLVVCKTAISYIFFFFVERRFPKNKTGTRWRRSAPGVTDSTDSGLVDTPNLSSTCRSNKIYTFHQNTLFQPVNTRIINLLILLIILIH